MKPQSVCVVGGAGFMGSILVPKLLAAGHRVNVLDNLTFGLNLPSHPALRVFRGDVREIKRYRTFPNAVFGCESVIHLACISNDPSAEIDPALTKAVNLDSFEPCVRVCRESGVQRFVFASSSSVYGSAQDTKCHEEHPLLPLTAYSRFKVSCESILSHYQSPNFTTVAVRPGTLMGCSPRMRFDLSVNQMVHEAAVYGTINVRGPSLKRCPTHVEDVAELYLRLLDPEVTGVIAGQAFNAGATNHTLGELAHVVRHVAEDELGRPVEIVHTGTDDQRSYHIDSTKAKQLLGWQASRTVEQACREVCQAFKAGTWPAPNADTYFNVRHLKATAERRTPDAAR